MPIPGGRFHMGSPKDEHGHAADEGPVHEVRIDPFWMEAHEVTWDEIRPVGGAAGQGAAGTWKRVPPSGPDRLAMRLPSRRSHSPTWLSAWVNRDVPAVNMTQFSAKVYCKWLSARTGRQPFTIDLGGELGHAHRRNVPVYPCRKPCRRMVRRLGNAHGQPVGAAGGHPF